VSNRDWLSKTEDVTRWRIVPSISPSAYAAPAIADFGMAIEDFSNRKPRNAST